MKRRTRNRVEWLASLSTREIVIFLLELARAQEQQPELEAEVSEACAVLRRELLRREWPVAAA